jgi:hypothetical protein
MNWFRRPGVIHLDCFTSNSEAYTFNKINHTRYFIPEWWKNLSKYDETQVHPYGSMKSCYGLIDLFRKGVVLPLWTDLVLYLGEIGSNEFMWQYADSKSNAEIHTAGQRGTYLPETHFQHLKLESPWLFECKEDLHWMTQGITWCFDDPSLIIPQGMLNFKYQIGTNFNFFLKRKEEKQKFIMEAGQPLLQFIPMSEKKIVLHHHLVDDREMYVRSGKKRISKFRNSYVVSKKTLEKQSKCPFGFK